MRLRYELTRLDLFRAGVRAIFYTRILLLLIVPAVLFTWWSTFTYEDPKSGRQPVGVRVFAATFTSLCCVVVGVLGGAVVTAAQSFLRRDQGVLGEHTLEISDEGLIESTSVNRSVAKWATSFRVRETGRYAYIYVSETNYHLIPKTNPPLEGSVSEFLNALRTRIKHNGQCSPPPLPSVTSSNP
jgi:hypothetical protein